MQVIEGNRVIDSKGNEGVVTAVLNNECCVKWDNGMTGSFSFENLKLNGIRKLIKDTYFKDFGQHISLISGRPIPVDIDDVCRDTRFVNCYFHCGCSVPYENCEFIDCDGTANCSNERK